MSHRDRTDGDRVLGYHWRVSPELVEKLGLDPGGRAAAQRARRSIVAALALAAETNRTWISYSRSKDWYAGGARYPGCDYTYDTVVPAADDLIEAGLVEEERGLAREGGSGIQSRMRASDLFLQRLGGDFAVKHIGPGSNLIMRDEDGRMAPLPRTERVARMVKAMDAVNAGIRDIRLTVSPDASPEDWRFGPRQWAARKVCKNGEERWAYVLPTPHHYLVRILGRGRLDCHGRLYGWHLGLPRLRRRELLIDGLETAEPDFEFLHPTLLYAFAGATLEGDPYVTDVHDRDHNKLALNIAINAPGGRFGAIHAIARHPKWQGEWGLSQEYAAEVYDEVARRNAPIARYLASDAGIHLMGIDGRMCMQVLKGCREAAIPALPVHDSFIVPKDRNGEVEAIMDRTLHEVRVGISSGTTKASFGNALQKLSPARSSASASSPARKAKPKRVVVAPSEKRPAKVVSLPVQTVEAEPAPEPIPADFDLQERVLALRERYEAKARGRHRKLTDAARSGWGERPSYEDKKRDFADAKRAAEALAEAEANTGFRIVLDVPWRLSEDAKARRAKRLAPRPMPAWLAARRRPQSTRGAKPEATLPPIQA